MKVAVRVEADATDEPETLPADLFTRPVLLEKSEQYSSLAC